MNYQALFESKLDTIRQEGRYRVFAELERIQGEFPYAWRYVNGERQQKVVVWCSNDYLSMGQNPHVLQAMHDTLDECGAGAGGTRNISGTTHHHVKLEQKLASIHKKEASLLFTSGYAANEATLSALGFHIPDLLVFSDEWNHASMIYGIRYGQSDKCVFKHNDVDDLVRQLKKTDKKRPKIIAFESLYSMDGDFAPISKFCDLAHEYNALTYVDEVHAIGVYGAQGAGLVEAAGEEDRISIICSNFGKAVGVMGGYISASKSIVDFVRSFAPPFIFTTALPPAVAAGAYASIDYFGRHSLERDALWAAVQRLKNNLRQAGFYFLDQNSHIIPLIVGEASLCKDVTDRLLNTHHIYVQPINYPTVPKGTERMRITPTPGHTPQMINDFTDALIEVWDYFGLERKKMTA